MAMAFVTAALASVPPKRGFVADTRNGTCADAQLLSAGTSWYYDYNVGDPCKPRHSPPTSRGPASPRLSACNWRGSDRSGDLKCNNTNPQHFVPMHWCISALHNNTPPAYVDTSFMLGFNEPNNLHNCNKDAATVARAWSQVMREFPDSTLITPATAGDGRTWFREWFGNCTAMYGPSGCNVTVMAVHSYICDATRLHSYLEEVHHEFGLPIWLTEFACGDHHDNRPLSEQLAFMREVLPILDASHIVERYAWMAARQGDPAQDARGLLVPGKPELTELGKLYTSLRAPPPATVEAVAPPPTPASASCEAYDEALAAARSTFCASGFCAAPPNASAKHDWPSQATYMHALLAALASDAGCFNTSAAAAATLAWLDVNQTTASGNPSSWGWTWLVFQVQYYDMPRKPGVRIEAPDTLGRKCWAFAYLDQRCDATALAARAPAFAAEWARAVPLTLGLCERVMANCFVNQSYDPSRNGTCPTKIFEFRDLGFERENLLRGFPVDYRFH